MFKSLLSRIGKKSSAPAPAGTGLVTVIVKGMKTAVDLARPGAYPPDVYEAAVAVASFNATARLMDPDALEGGRS